MAELSGGEQQRVALARALAPAPGVLLLDEPLGALDRGLRDRLVPELAALFHRIGTTVVYVTHDQSEALGLADRVVVMEAGRIVQSATPDVVWSRPASAAVAGLLGFTNILDAAALGGLGLSDMPWGASVRPEAVHLLAAGSIAPTDAGADAGAGAVGAVVEAAVFRGPHTMVTVRLASGHRLDAAVANDETTPSPGQAVDVRIDPGGVAAIRPP